MTNAFFRSLATAIFVVSLPVLIFTSTAKTLFLDAGYYDRIQAAAGVLETSGLPTPTLQAANRSLTAYFASRETTLEAELKRQGLPVDFFGQRESDHLVDVKNMVWGAIVAQQGTLGYVLLFLIANVLLSPKRFLQNIRRPLLWGSALTLAILVILGVLSQIDFSGAWLLFHVVSFSNDLWALNPNTDVLVKMVPEPFWFRAILTGAGYCAIEALGVGIVGALLHWPRLGLSAPPVRGFGP